MRTIPDLQEFFQPLEDAIRLKFLPSLTGREVSNETERELLALPARLGGLGISIPTTVVSRQFASSSLVTAPIVELIHQKNNNYPNETS